jgi:GntR family transcriptional regulator
MTGPSSNERAVSGLTDSIWNGLPRENLTTRVANAIRHQVLSGKLPRGMQLRGEIEFARELGVSRQTLREATRLLTREGLLTIRHGVGTFVAEPAVFLSSPLNSMHSMSALIRESGAEARVSGLKIRQVGATAEISKALDIVIGAPVAEIVRLRLMDTRPLAVAYDYIALLEDADWKLPLIKTFDGGSIYEFMAERLQCKLVASEASLTAIAAGKRHAELLKVKAGFPLLLMREKHCDDRQRQGLYSTIFHNSALMDFTLVRPGSHA